MFRCSENIGAKECSPYINKSIAMNIIQTKHLLKAQAFVVALPTNRALVLIVPFLDPIPIVPYACWLRQSLALGRAKEFAHITKVLAPIALASTFFETINTLCTLHHLKVWPKSKA